MIISRYVLREIVVTLIAVTAVLYVIYVSNRFIRFLADAESSSLPASVLFQLLGLKSLSNLAILLPLALFSAVLIAFGRLYSDNEMLALSACGVGSGTLLRAVGGLGVVLAAVVATVSLTIGPWAEEKSYQIQDAMQASADMRALSAGRFRELRDGQVVFYTEKWDPDANSMEQVFVQTQRDGAFNVITAARGHFDWVNGDRYLILQDGYRYEGEPGDPGFKMVSFHEHGLLIQEQEIVPASRKLIASSTPALWRAHGVHERAELQWRVSMPIATLLLAILAVPLSHSRPRQGRYARLFIALLIYVVYMNALAVARSWMDRGTLSPLLGLWWVHGLPLLLTAVLLLQQFGLRWLSLRFLPKRTA